MDFQSWCSFYYWLRHKAVFMFTADLECPTDFLQPGSCSSPVHWLWPLNKCTAAHNIHLACLPVSNGLTHTFPGTDTISMWISNASRKSLVCGSTFVHQKGAWVHCMRSKKCKELRKNKPITRKAENVAFWHMFICKNPRLLSVDISTFSPHFRQLQWCDSLVNKSSSYHLLLLAVAST